MIRKELLKMEKTYEELEMEVITFEAEDIITASSECTTAAGVAGYAVDQVIN